MSYFSIVISELSKTSWTLGVSTLIGNFKVDVNQKTTSWYFLNLKRPINTSKNEKISSSFKKSKGMKFEE